MLLHLINFLPHRGLSLSLSLLLVYISQIQDTPSPHHPSLAPTTSPGPHHSPQFPPLVPRLESEEKWNFDEVSHVSSYCISSLYCHSVLFQHNFLISDPS